MSKMTKMKINRLSKTHALGFGGAIVILWFFFLMAIFVYLITIKLPFVQLIWTESGGAITYVDYGNFLMVMFILVAIIVIIILTWTRK